MPIAENIRRVQFEIASAARAAGRSPDEISLMAVTKGVTAQSIQEAYAAGVRLFGENRVQEFSSKLSFLGDLEGARWHLIGHLQSNKARRALEIFAAVDSVDSVHLAQKLERTAAELRKRVPVLVEINVGCEAGKSGLAMDSEELTELLRLAAEFPSLDFCGLMTIPPFGDDAEQSRPYFREMRRLFSEIRQRKLPRIRMDVLSMGMSHDFPVAVEEGATCVRVGTAIFGERKA